MKKYLQIFAIFIAATTLASCNPNGNLNGDPNVDPSIGPIKPDKDGVAIATTVSSVWNFTAVCKGYIAADGGNEIFERGICFSTNENPTLADIKIAATTLGLGTYEIRLKDLTTYVTYYIRAYAVNATGVHYGNQQVVTLDKNVKFASSKVTDFTSVGATFESYIFGGGLTVNNVRLCLSTAQDPTLEDVVVSPYVNYFGHVSFNIPGLVPATTYYFRPVAQCGTDNFYGDQVTITTKPLECSSKSYVENGKNLGEAILIGGDFDGDSSTPNTILFWAPVNCGYEETGAVDSDSDHRLGKLYQWGAGDSSLPYKYNGSPVVAREMYYDTTTPSPWYGNKTIVGTTSDKWNNNQGPCPEGWRLPTYQEFIVLCAGKNGKYGWVLAGTYAGQSNKYPGAEFFGVYGDKTPGTGVFFPAAGVRGSRDGSAFHRGARGFYCSSSPGPGSSDAHLLSFDSSSLDLVDIVSDRAGACSVRCVSE